MKRILFLCIALALVACGGVGYLTFNGPGEFANYKKNDDRTSNVISDASGYARIDGETETAYQVHLEYKVRALMRTHRDELKVDVEKVFFTEQYKQELRAEGTKQHDDFKVTHRGFDGTCDDITISDIEGIGTGEFEDVSVDAHVCPGVPVMGAQRFDLKGKVRGRRVTIGLDYYVP